MSLFLEAVEEPSVSVRAVVLSSHNIESDSVLVCATPRPLEFDPLVSQSSVTAYRSFQFSSLAYFQLLEVF